MLRRGLLAFAFALGCAPQGRDVELRFVGRPAPGAFAADTREVAEACPACRMPVDRAASVCPHPKDGRPCAERLRHPDRAPCGFCRGKKACAPCAAFETRGLCRFCAGSGRRGTEGCFGCRGSGACAACAGSAACDACAGSGSIALPWARPAPRTGARPPGVSLGVILEELEPPLAWLGETFVLPRLPEEGGGWTVSVDSGGRLAETERVAPGSRFTPRQPGSFLAKSGTRAVFFDVVSAEVRLARTEEGGAARRGAAAVGFSPPLRDAKIRWKWVNPDGVVTWVDGPGLSMALEGSGRHEAWPAVAVPGLTEREVPRPALFSLSSLSIRAPSDGRVRSGAPVAFEARSSPPLPEGTPYEWTLTDAGGKGEETLSEGPSAGIAFPAAGRFHLRVRAAGNVSPPVEIVAHRVTLAGADGRTLPEASLALLSGKEVPSEAWLENCPERFRIVVEDPSPDPPGSLAVSVRSWNGAALGPDVTYALAPEKRARATRPIALLGDRSDDAVPLGGTPDGASEDATRFAVPRGRVEVSYRGVTAPVAGVGPMIVHEIPVRFIAVGPGFPPREELERILDRRLEEAGAVWAPFGRRFARASLEVRDPPRNLLLVRGRGAGVDAHGRPSRLGARVGGVEASVPLAWRGEGGPAAPAAIARTFAARIDPSFAVDVYEKMLPSDREAAVLRVRRRDGRPVVLEPLREGQDVSQAVTVLGADLSDGCEVTTDPALLSLEELSILLGLRGGGSEGMDLFLVGRLTSDAEKAALFKFYPDDVFPAPLSGAAIVAWEIADGSGRYPYALARVLGSLLLPPGWRPRPEDSLFHRELSPAAAPDANKRVGAATGAKIRERGRGLATKNDDSTRGNEQGGK